MRFDVESLQRRAGDKTFSRGDSYYRNERVEIVLLDDRRIVALVAGTEDYRTEIAGGGNKISGKCSCPAFEDSGFCKHMVATALTANDHSGSADIDMIGRIRGYLRTKSIDELVDFIIDLAEHDIDFFHALYDEASTPNA